MAVIDELEKNVPDYSVNYDDPRFGKVESDENQALTELEQTYGGIIESTDQYYDKQIQASQDWADEQTALQQEQTDFAIEKIEQQKDQAAQDYKKEQSASYVDWQKQSNPYGVNAEKIASAGLTNTGYSESSQVSMYNTYQNRVATAREVYNRAVLNYDNAIKDAILQNNATLAEIAHTALTEQLALASECFQYKNSLVLDLADKKMQTKQFYAQQWQNVLNQINTENALAEDIRQFNTGLAWDTEQKALDREFSAEQSRLDREFNAAQAELNRKFEADQAELERKFKMDYLKAESEEERKRIQQEHNNEMARLKQQYQYESALLAQENSYSRSSISDDISGKRITDNNITVSTPTFNDRDAANKYMASLGAPSSYTAATLTRNEWSRRRSSYLNTGIGGDEVKLCESYKEYLTERVSYVALKYGK